MSWITVAWSMGIAASLTLAGIHLVIWSRRRAAWASLLFAGVAISLAGMAVFEFLMMRSQTPAEFSAMNRCMHVAAFAISSSIVWFIRVYLRAGRLWCLWSVIVLRATVLALAFLLPMDVNYKEIHALEHPLFLGEPVAVPLGVRSPWSWLDELSALGLIVFVTDASITLWRRGDREERRRALVVGGSMALFVLVALTHVTLARLEVIRAPQMAGLTFLVFLAAMAHEMSRDLARAAHLADELRETEQQMKLAASAAHLGLWTWDTVRDAVWITDEGRALYGWGKSDPVTFANFMEKVHPEDREATRTEVLRALNGPGSYHAEYRVQLADGATRWIAARGQVEFNGEGIATRMRGVSIDVTAHKQAEADAQRQQAELAHVARVSTMGELAASVAHELNQPLGAILANAEAADLFLKMDPPATGELSEILADIRRDNDRASEVIRRMRDLLRKAEMEMHSLDLNSIVEDVFRILSGDAALRKIALIAELSPGLPPVRGDRVHLQQVLLNLAMNAMEAMTQQPRERRRLIVRTTGNGEGAVEIAVTDFGHGIEPQERPRLFEPFFTTKPNGMGMGLSIARRIVEAHHGCVSAEPSTSGGSTFRVSLPVDIGERKLASEKR